MPADTRQPAATWLLLFAGAAVLLAIVATLSPLPDRVTDRDVYEATAARGIVPDCTDLHCFRVLVAWTLGAIPGPSLLKWKGYAVVANAAAAAAVFQLALAFGLSRRGAAIAFALSAFGFGSLYTLHDVYTSDPLMFCLGPLITCELLRGRVAAAGIAGTIGVLAKEFAAAPLFIGAAWAAAERRLDAAADTLVWANLAFIAWLALQLTLMLRFNYGYGGNPSTHLLGGGFLLPWITRLSPRGAASALFNEYGAVYLLAPAGFWWAGGSLRRLALLSVPVAIVFAYVQQPDRALWNFHYVAAPLAAFVLERVAAPLAWSIVTCFGVANLKVGAQLPFVPSARFALALSCVLAVAAIAQAARQNSSPVWPGRLDAVAKS